MCEPQAAAPNRGIKLPPTADEIRLALAVVVPCHNEVSTLRTQLQALTSERWHRPWGIVVVDNASTDGTGEVAHEFAELGVRLVRAVDGRGVAYARNVGAASVVSDSVAFCDGDDKVMPGWVAGIGDALESADAVSGFSDVDVLNPDWLAATRPRGRPGSLPRFGDIEFLSGCTLGVRRELFERLEGFDCTFEGLEDIEFSLRAQAVGARLAPADAVVAYRYRSSMRDTWRQGFYYGRGRPELIRRARQLKLQPPSRLEGVRSWGWLLVHLPGLRTRTGRYSWCWVLANRLGVLRGAMAVRFPCI